MPKLKSSAEKLDSKKAKERSEWNILFKNKT